MSYICLLATSRFAVAASDSRETKTRSHKYKDSRQKTFASDQGHLIWCCCGATVISRFIFMTDCMKRVYKVLRDDQLPLEKRMEVFKAFIKEATRPALFSKKKKYTFTILYAFSDKKSPPVIGTVTARDGVITDDRLFTAPVMLQAGRNAAMLTPASGFKPLDNETLETICTRAVKRVREAVEKDVELKAADRSYVATVGGDIQLKMLTFPGQN